MSSTPYQRVERFLEGLRRRQNGAALAEAVWTGLIIALSGLLLGLCLALLLGPSWGPLGWVPIGGAGVGTLVAIWRLWWRPRRARATNEQLARWVEHHVPGLHSGIITTVQAAEVLRDGDVASWPGLSPEFAELTASRTASTLDSLPDDVLVDPRPVGRLARLGGVFLAISLLCVAGNLDLMADALRHLRGAHVSHAIAGDLELSEVPVLVGDITLRLLYPAYLDRPPKDISRSGGDISAAVGTEVRFSATLLEIAAEALLVLESDPEGRWPLTLQAGGALHGSVRVGQDDRYRFLVVAPSGNLLLEKRWRSIDAQIDEAPRVHLLFPETDVEVNAADTVTVLFDVNDDHGVGEVELLVDRGEGRGRIRRVISDATGQKQHHGDARIAISPLGLTPGESIDIWLEAKDLNDETGPGIGRSVTRRISIYSPDAEHQARLKETDQVVDELIDVLADRLESPIDKPAAARFKEDLNVQATISERSEAVMKGFEALVVSMSTDSLASVELRDRVRETFDTIRLHYELEAAQIRQILDGKAYQRRASQLMKVMQSHNEEGIGVLEVGVLELKDLVDQNRQARVLDQGRALLEAQTELMEFLKSLDMASGDQATQEALRQLQALEDHLSAMERALSELVENLPYQNQNLSGQPSDDEMDVRSIRERMAEIRQLLQQGRLEEAQAALEELNRESQQLLASLQDSFGHLGPMQKEARHALGELSIQLGELADAQGGLRQETEQAKSAHQERREHATKSRVDKLLEGIDKQVVLLLEALEIPSENSLYDADTETLGTLRLTGRQLRESVQARELQGARVQAERVAGGAAELRSEVADGESREEDAQRSKGMKAAIESLADASQIAGAIVEELKALEKALEIAMTAKEKQRLERLRKRQNRLQSELERLDEIDEAIGEHSPEIQEALDNELKEAGQCMQNASEGLQGKQTGEAIEHQRQAQQRLEQAQQSIQHHLEQANRHSSSASGPGFTGSDERVKIPDEDAYQSPEAFRKELLKAMKERAPERYRKAIKHYYEELVR